MTVSQLLYEHMLTDDNNKPKQLFDLRNLILSISEYYNFNIDKSKSIFICSKTKHISQINYLNHTNKSNNFLKNDNLKIQ